MLKVIIIKFKIKLSMKLWGCSARSTNYRSYSTRITK